VVEKALDRICAQQIIGVIVGAPGAGMSKPIDNWRQTRQIKHVWIEATLGESLQATLDALTEGLGVPHGSIDRMALKVAESLAESPVAVIIDEADFLRPAAFNKLRAIWDRVCKLRKLDDRAFPLALVGTFALRTKLMRDEERCEQILRRVGEFDEVPPLTLAETEGVLQSKWGLSEGAGAEIRLDAGAAGEMLRMSRGSFGWLNKIVPLAIDLARKDGKVITPRLVRATSRYLVGVAEEGK